MNNAHASRTEHSTTLAEISHTDVAVLGLGSMGAALARAFVAGGLSTTVWNRTAAKAEPLVASGAVTADGVESAVRSANLIVTCLRDHHATRELLTALPAEVLFGRTVVVLASATPAEARATQEWAAERELSVLVGAIMVPTPLVSTPAALILYAGSRQLLDRHREVLEVIAPRSEHVGDDPGLAALLDTAMLQVFFGGLTAFMYATALANAQGLSSAEFLPWAKEMLAILPDAFDGTAAEIDAVRYPGTEDTLDMELAAFTHMVESSREAGFNNRFAVHLRELAQRAVDDGYGGDSWSRAIEYIRRPGGNAR